jgi:glutathione S-transferase
MTCIEKGIDYQLIPVAYGSSAHGALHPFRRMPILELDDGALIIESLAITGYLDEAFPGPVLQPGGIAERVRMRTWMAITSDYLFRDVVRSIPRDRPPTDAVLTTARTALERAEQLVGEGPYLAGHALSLADLYLAPQLANCREKAPLLLDGLEALGAWETLVRQRQSFRRTSRT